MQNYNSYRTNKVSENKVFAAVGSLQVALSQLAEAKMNINITLNRDKRHLTTLKEYSRSLKELKIATDYRIGVTKDFLGLCVYLVDELISKLNFFASFKFSGVEMIRKNSSFSRFFDASSGPPACGILSLKPLYLSNSTSCKRKSIFLGILTDF